VSIGQATSDLEDEMDRLGVDEWRVSTGSGRPHVKQHGLPKYSANPDEPGVVLRWTMDGYQHAVACDKWDSVRDNLRELYLYVREKRKMESRPVVTGESEFANARLPSGDDEAIVVEQEPPHEVLDIQPDASESIVKAAFQEKVKETHPDTESGSAEELKRVREAREAMMDGQ
jgi:hypothetical protein